MTDEVSYNVGLHLTFGWLKVPYERFCLM